jgi:hypothetical protein
MPDPQSGQSRQNAVLDNGNGEEELEEEGTKLPDQEDHSHVIWSYKCKACYDMKNAILCHVTHDGGGGHNDDNDDDDDDDDHNSHTLAYCSSSMASYSLAVYVCISVLVDIVGSCWVGHKMEVNVCHSVIS